MIYGYEDILEFAQYQIDEIFSFHSDPLYSTRLPCEPFPRT
jgi:hypothetical protein